jgi:hypothetical protein
VFDKRRKKWRHRGLVLVVWATWCSAPVASSVIVDATLVVGRWSCRDLFERGLSHGEWRSFAL